MSKQTDNKQFWQRWASCYGPLMQSSEPLYAAIAQQMQPHLTPEMNVLELACGSGQLSFRLSRLVRDWEATDFSPKMIAQAKLKPRGAGLHFSVQDATSLPYADETFDAVLIANALHIMPRPEKALAEIYRVLKPGGQLLFSTLLVDSLWQLREAWGAVDGHAHVNRFLALPQLQQAIGAAGFQAPELTSVTWSLAYVELNDLLRDLKGIGASQVNDDRAAGLGNRQRLRRLGEAYERHRQPDGLLAASYEVCLGRLVRR